MQNRWRRGAIAWGSFALGVALTILVGLGDWNATADTWMDDHPYSKEALTGLIGLVVTVWLLATWLGWRDSRRLRRVAVIAYRSLGQAVNDSGRRILAPINGSDLWALGIPEADPDAARDVRAWLESHGLRASPQHAGEWESRRDELKPVLTEALRDRKKVGELFRAASSARRVMQAATAQWAPTLFVIKGPAAQALEDVQEFTDVLELLQTALRRIGGPGHVDPRDAQEEQRVEAANLYWYTVHLYERELMLLEYRGRLPSQDEELTARFLDTAARWAAESA
jgi:hypothetical protein